MNTKEHEEAGEGIKYETLGNPYIKEQITKMASVDGMPVPEDEVNREDFVAQGGDYWTLAGLGLRLKSSEKREDLYQDVSCKEAAAFHQAYADMASSNKADMERIYAIDRANYIPFSKTLNELVQQLIYALTVKNYINKLLEDEAHFTPWSTRAYIVGHHYALQRAALSFYCKKMAFGEEVPEEYKLKISAMLELIEKTTELSKLKLTPEIVADKKALLLELSHRLHAEAFNIELFTMHFYSDHFAGGHLRLNALRESLSKNFGLLGNILVNSMHNEDNINGVPVKHPYRPLDPAVYVMPEEEFKAYGDGTYDVKGNDENANFLVNGMTYSLQEINKVVQTGATIHPENYGGLSFLPEVDYTKPQLQPLLVQGNDGKIYCRKGGGIRTLLPADIEKMLRNPQNYGYEKLTYGKACLYIVRNRFFSCICGDKVVEKEAAYMKSIPLTA